MRDGIGLVHGGIGRVGPRGQHPAGMAARRGAEDGDPRRVQTMGGGLCPHQPQRALGVLERRIQPAAQPSPGRR